MPFMEKQAGDLMVPLSEYPVVSVKDSLGEAVYKLSEAHFDPRAKLRHRVLLVMDNDGKLVGILDLRRILASLIPENVGAWSEKLKSMLLAHEGLAAFDESKQLLRVWVWAIKEADLKVGEIMLKVRGAIQRDSSLIEAIRMKCKRRPVVLPVYDGDELVGVLRDVDLFLLAAQILKDGGNEAEDGSPQRGIAARD